MTQTYTIGVLHWFSNLGPHVVIPPATTVDGTSVWNFEFGLLGFV